MIEKTVRNSEGPIELGPLRCITLDMLPKSAIKPVPIPKPKITPPPEKIPKAYFDNCRPNNQDWSMVKDIKPKTTV